MLFRAALTLAVLAGCGYAQLPRGRNVPAQCLRGDVFVLTVPGQKATLYICTGDNTWEQVSAGGGGAVNSVFGQTGDIVADESHYALYYPRLSQTYSDPEWIESLDYNKLIGHPYGVVRSGAGADQTPRSRLRFDAGTNVTITPSDNPADNETILTISATGSGGGLPECTQAEAEGGTVNTCAISPRRWVNALDFRIAPPAPAYANMALTTNASGTAWVWRPPFLVQGNTGGAFPARQHLRFANTASVTWSCTDDSANDRTNCEATASGGGGGGGGGGGLVKEYRTKCQNTVAGTAFSFGTTGAPTPLCDSGSSLLFGALRFTANGDAVQDAFTLPASLSSMSVFAEARTESTSGNSVWTVDRACIAAGGAYGNNGSSGPSFSTVATLTFPANATPRAVVTQTAAIDLTGCAANDTFAFRISRSASTTTTNPELMALVFRVQ